MTKPLTAQDYTRRLSRVAAHIYAHLDEPLDLEKLAEIACFSPFHFHRIYHAAMGETLADTVSRHRLQRAAMQLARGPLPIAEIARHAGYSSTAAFGRAFRAAYGRPPAAFRAERLSSFTPAAARNKGSPAMSVEIKDRQPMRIAAVPHRGPPKDIGRAFERVVAWAGPRGITLPPSVGVALYLDDMSVVPPEDQRALAGVTVGPDVIEDDVVTITEVPGGRHAVLLFKGPYAQLHQAYNELFTWLPHSGEEPADRPMFEVNLNDPRSTPPTELLTEICLPLK